jgi:Mg-chelatase subunit ChlD
MASTVPQSFKCPITHEIMKDPVMCDDGHTYERTAIARWLETHSTSPMTNIRISHNLVSNHSLRNSIEEFLGTSTQPSIHTEEITYIKPNLKVLKSNNTLQVKCEDVQCRSPVDFVFAIDNSASMHESAGIQGDLETQCYSRLDLVKHATLCIVETLGPQDTLGVVLYSTNSRILVNPMNMTDQNKQYVISCIKNIYIEGSTNLWDGLHRCLQLTENSTHASPCVLLFTDGMPTVGDLQVDKAYQRYVNQTKNTKTHVYTFGFSNCVNSQLLNNISNIGNGQFHFISDSAMLFTTIINFMSNYLTMYGDIIVNGINYGQLYYGQSKYISYSNNVNELVIANIYGETIQVNEVETINEEKFGIDLYNTINMIEQLVSSRNFGELNSIFQNHMNSLNNDTNNQMVGSLIENLNDQVRLAISTQYYNTWGKHYLYSFLNAIKNQINNNFKDTLAQNFGGTQFLHFSGSAKQYCCKCFTTSSFTYSKWK